MVHELKCWPKYFKAVESGEKPFELRLNDRGFEVGDTLELHEWDPAEGTGYTGKVISREVTYILSLDSFMEAISAKVPGLVIMGLKAPEIAALRAEIYEMRVENATLSETDRMIKAEFDRLSLMTLPEIIHWQKMVEQARAVLGREADSLDG